MTDKRFSTQQKAVEKLGEGWKLRREGGQKGLQSGNYIAYI